MIMRTIRKRLRMNFSPRSKEEPEINLIPFIDVLLVILIFTHLFINLMVGDGIKAVDFGFVAGKWASPLWQVWDLVMLWLAMLHGTNGVRTIINDYAEKNSTRMWLKTVLYSATVVIIVLGTLVIFTFDPCPANATLDQLPSFCPAP